MPVEIYTSPGCQPCDDLIDQIKKNPPRDDVVVVEVGEHNMNDIEINGMVAVPTAKFPDGEMIRGKDKILEKLYGGRK